LILDSHHIEQIKAGDRKVILALYHHTFNVLMGTAVRYKNHREDQMEIVNNAFLKIVTNIHTFQPGTAYFSWAKRIVQREIIDDFRRNKSYKALFELGNCSSVDKEELHPEIDYSIEDERLQHMLDTLPPATRMVFNLYAIDGYENKEIGELLSISYETVKWHIKEARTRLKKLLVEQEIPVR
jgi:RNA polymerase sigma factor (sigma-70 family)